MFFRSFFLNLYFRLYEWREQLLKVMHNAHPLNQATTYSIEEAEIWNVNISIKAWISASFLSRKTSASAERADEAMIKT